jgi:hypothetical protein
VIFPFFEESIIARGYLGAHSFYFYGPITRFWEFGIGGIAFYLHKTGRFLTIFKQKANRSLFVVTLLVLLVFARNVNSFPLITIVLLTAFILILGFDVQKPIGNFFARLGDFSYSTYLVHLPIIVLIHELPLNFTSSEFFYGLVVLILSVVLGFVFFSAIEQPFRHESHKFNSDTLRFPKGIAFILTTALIIPLLSFAEEKIITRNYFGLDRNLRITFDNPKSGNCQEIDTNFCSHVAKNPQKVVMLIGDSHAEQFNQLLAELSLNRNISFLDASLASCPFLPVSNTTWRNYILSNCHLHNINITKYLGSEHVDYLIVSQNIVDEKELKLAMSALKELQSYSQRILYVGQTPNFLDGRTFFPRSLLFPRLDYPVSDIPLTGTNQNALQISKHTESQLENSHIKFVDSFKILCGSGLCTRFSNMKWLYRDDNHLTYPGSLKFKGEFEKFMGVS